MLKTTTHSHALVCLCSLALGLSACGGSSDSGTTAATSAATSTSGAAVTATTTTGTSTTTTGSTSTSAGTTGTTTGTSTTGTGTTSSGSTTNSAGTSSAAALAIKLGKRNQLLVGFGSQGDLANSDSSITAQSIHIDIYERYLGIGDWTAWNSNPDYVHVVAAQADAMGAVPMFTQYQMANNGENNKAALVDASFMTTYWARATLLFKDLGTYGKPALVNLEPDFWSYMEQDSTNNDPTTVAALVNSSSVANPDCAAQPNNVKGVAGCLLVLARKYAPKAYVGFPPQTWGASSEVAVIAFMNAIGAQNADFIVEQTLDRDAGCYEASPQPSQCAVAGTGRYWDETNATHPNFQDHLAIVQQDHAGIGNLPVIWWQTPEGVPSSTPGGTPDHYRDNRAHYFLTHPAQLTAVGGLAVVFGNGASGQTNIGTDGGQMAALDAAYQAAPTVLP